MRSSRAMKIRSLTPLAILSFLTALAAYGACPSGKRSLATNMAADLEGDNDTGQGVWGKAGYVLSRITFTPPKGCRVRILRVYGDFLAWPRGVVPAGKYAGVLWGLQTTAPEGSVWADYAADNTMLYVQHATSGQPVRTPINFDVTEGGLLGPDHVLVSKLAVWLNDTGLQIHMEPTFVVVYEFVEPPTT
jgi:hypothetical protein